MGTTAKRAAKGPQCEGGQSYDCSSWLARVLIGFLFALFTCSPAFAQEGGTVTGTVVSTWDGTPLAGVVVTVRGTTLAAQTDAAGRYQLSGAPPGDQVLRFSRSGYASAVVTDVRVLPGQTTTVNGNLRPEFYEMEEYEVTAEEFAEQTEKILFERQQSSAMMDAIGSDFMLKVGVGDAAEAVAKVTGTTIVDGKFAVIRGLADRYTATTLNGGEIPSADPYRKAAQLDLIPSEMIERITVSKTFTPDQPGGFTGGAVDIVTRSFPEKLTFSAAFGVEYNTEATGNKDFLTYKGGSTDWLGIDDGTREEPSELVDIEDVTTLPPALSTNLAVAQEYQKLLRAFESTQFAPKREAPPPNHSFSLSVGDSMPIGESRLGYFAGLSYDRDFSHYEGTSRRFYPVFPAGSAVSRPQVFGDVMDTRSFDKISWAGIVGLALQIQENHEVGFTFLYNQLSEDLGRLRVGRTFDGQFPISEGGSGSDTDTVSYLNELHWTERHLETYQIRGRHEFPLAADAQLDWLVSLANTTQEEPDLRYFNFRWSTNGGVTMGNSAGVPEPSDPTRYFRDLNEDNRNYKMDATVPIRLFGADGIVKFGPYRSESERQFEERTWSFKRGNIDTTTDPLNYPNGYMDPVNTRIITNITGIGPFRRTNYTFIRQIASDIGNSSYEGMQQIDAAYLMTEVRPLPRTRLLAGVRYEKTDMEIDFQTTRGQGTPSAQAKLEQTDWLPAVALTWEIVTNMNLRFGFSQTVARPTYREIAPYRSYDVTGDEILEGNAGLQMSNIDNYDVRWEWFRRPGEVLSVGLFYKDISMPIEKVSTNAQGDIVTFLNFPSATVYGVEFEARTSLGILHDSLADFSIGANAALIESEVEIPDSFVRQKLETTGIRETSRPLYDQSPYIINTDITYDNRASGTAVTLAFNLSGERLYSYGLVTYDVYEYPGPQLDLFITHRLGKRWKLKFSAKNLLDPEYKRTYGEPGEFGDDALYSSYKKGRSFGISLSCTF